MLPETERKAEKLWWNPFLHKLQHYKYVLFISFSIFVVAFFPPQYSVWMKYNKLKMEICPFWCTTVDSLWCFSWVHLAFSFSGADPLSYHLALLRFFVSQTQSYFHLCSFNLSALLLRVCETFPWPLPCPNQTAGKLLLLLSGHLIFHLSGRMRRHSDIGAERLFVWCKRAEVVKRDRRPGQGHCPTAALISQTWKGDENGGPGVLYADKGPPV